MSCLRCELVWLSWVLINYFGHSFSEIFAVQCSELKWPRNNSLTEPDTLAYIQRELYCSSLSKLLFTVSFIGLHLSFYSLLHAHASIPGCFIYMSKYVVTPSLDVVCVATDIALAELWRTEAQPRQQESQLLFNSQCWQQQGLRHECVLLHPPDAKHPGTAPRGLLPGVADWLKKKQNPSCSQNDPA